jgi:hypothetical protein
MKGFGENSDEGNDQDDGRHQHRRIEFKDFHCSRSSSYAAISAQRGSLRGPKSYLLRASGAKNIAAPNR